MDSILLVEADVEISEQWTVALTAAGHSVLAASGMREALRLVQEGGINVVVIDVYDPRAGVVELARGMEALPRRAADHLDLGLAGGARDLGAGRRGDVPAQAVRAERGGRRGGAAPGALAPGPRGR